MNRPPGASSMARTSSSRCHCRAASSRQARRSASSTWSGYPGKTEPVDARPPESATQCIAVPVTATCTLPGGRQGSLSSGMPAMLITVAGGGLCSTARRHASWWVPGEA